MACLRRCLANGDLVLVDCALNNIVDDLSDGKCDIGVVT